MNSSKLTAQNAYLTEMLRQAGLDAEAQAVAARIQGVLTDEIHHRMKNMLAMVTAVVRRSMRSATSIAQAEAAISTRLIAMAKAHDILLKAELKSAALDTVIHGAIEQHDTAAARISIQGDAVQIIPASILPLSLILNELCTNATKYGALSNHQGSVALTWALSEKARALIIRWVEKNGPPVAPPVARSFGIRLIEDAIPRQLGGKGQLLFAPTGVEYELHIPYEAVQPQVMA